METRIQFFLLFFVVVINGFAQSNPVIDAFPKGTVLHGNVPYNNDDLHSEKDELVSTKQSQLLNALLMVSGVQNELIIVKDAPPFGEMFDADEIRTKVIGFLKKQLN